MPEPTGDTVQWQSIHVYYYDRDQDPLILGGVRPLFGRLAGSVAAVSYTRHWRLGPHVRMHFLTTPGTFQGLVRPATDEIVGGYLDRHPSTRQLDPASELPRHRRLAEQEREFGPLLPWCPDNSLRAAPYDRRLHVFGSLEAADLLADFQAASTDLAFRITEGGGGTPRLAVCFNLMVATAHLLYDGITNAFISFRSHAEGFLHRDDDGARLRAAWAEHYRRHAPGLRRRVEAVVAEVDDRRGEVPFVPDWIGILERFRSRAERLCADGRMPTSPPPMAPAPEPAVRDSGYLSPFHEALLANPRWETTQASTEFQVYRLLLNVTYLFLTRLGVVPEERFLLCHLAADAVEDQYGVSALELVSAPSKHPREA